MDHARGGRSTVALESYEKRTSVLMVSLAVIYIGIYAAQVLWISMPVSVDVVFGFASLAIWGSFIVDLSVRTWLAPRRLHYLAQHPLDLVAVIVPAFRALRVLRVFTAGQWFVTRGKDLTIGRTFLAIGIGATSILFLASLAFYDAERGQPETMIDSFGDSLWWGITTMSTVGYGDVYPTTPTGRLVAAALMIIGISLLGVITATVANWFITQTRRDDEAARGRRTRTVRRNSEHLRVSRRARKVNARVP